MSEETHNEVCKNLMRLTELLQESTCPASVRDDLTAFLDEFSLASERS